VTGDVRGRGPACGSCGSARGRGSTLSWASRSAQSGFTFPRVFLRGSQTSTCATSGFSKSHQAAACLRSRMCVGVLRMPSSASRCCNYRCRRHNKESRDAGGAPFVEFPIMICEAIEQRVLRNDVCLSPFLSDCYRPQQKALGMSTTQKNYSGGRGINHITCAQGKMVPP
jgi:hypothetical protein